MKLTMRNGLQTSGSPSLAILPLPDCEEPSLVLLISSSLASPSFSPQSRVREALAWSSLPLSTSQTGDSGVMEMRSMARAGTAVLTRHTVLQ